MALSTDDVVEIVSLYQSGVGCRSIGRTFKVSEQTVRYHLKRQGVYGMTAQNDDGVGETDADLGIGVEDAPAVATLEALMADPSFASLIDKAVQARMAQMGVAQAPTLMPNTNSAFDAFLEKLEHVIDVTNEQRPGYIKPLSADEMDRRAAGRTEMFALLARFKAERVYPHYLLGEQFYGPSPNGPILYDAGQEIRTFLPPAESFKPLNEPAAIVYSAYKKWVGEVVPVEDLLAQALIDARGGPRVAEVTDAPMPVESDVVLVDAPRRDVSPTRILGTAMPEQRGRATPSMPGSMAQPVGPVFVEG